MRAQREIVNGTRLMVTYLINPEFYVDAHPRGLLAGFAAMLRTAMRGTLSLLAEHKEHFFLVDTNIELGVPWVVRQHTNNVARNLLAGLEFIEL